ncbi:30S ribosomal protein S1 [Helicobacter monodelphidis]|uniref:30S ribosomal protein S1 n=1 Tax=Helicobacter sp. 15-1451 TaxID=2004995 RepID=UPI000DCC1F63|nr:30S ribosomal protein S1 [Helicobacter sp. 15-1451]RAX58857.1 30S ribosomal protein S1 [Helicobacter sp. 15-1451]
MAESSKCASFGEDEGEDFGAILDQFDAKSRSGKITVGTIVSINENEGIVLVDVGGKNEGRISVAEITENGELKFKKGDKIDVIVTNEHSEKPSVSHVKALKYHKVQEKIIALGDQHKDVVVEAKIVHKNHGGYTLEDDEGVEYFMPRKMSALKDDGKHLNKRIKVCIINVKPDEDTIVVSRKRFFDINNKIKKEGVQKLLGATEPLVGIIKKITAFGMFVEVEGIEGLVHYTEISYKGPVNPSKTFKEGEKVSVKAIGYDEEKKRLSLSIKATAEDPWKEIEDELEVGDAIKVVVSNVEPYGAFVDLGNDIEGFLHISEISWDKNIKHPGEHLKSGQEITVEVIEINVQSRRLRVSCKRMLERPFENFCKTHKEGDILTGEIATLTDFGAFIKIGGIDGLLHNEDAFWEKNLRCKEQMKEGDKVEVKIIKIDSEKERISLSRKHLLSSPADSFSKKHQVDDKVIGKIRDIKDFGVFINLEDGIDALIRVEDLAPLKKENLQVGDEIEGVISLIDRDNNRIRVSVKRLERKKEKEHIKAFNGDEKMTLGDVLKELNS